MLMSYDEEAQFRALEYFYARGSGSNLRYTGQQAPFFLCVSFHAPHEPFHVTQELWDLYEGEPIDIPEYPDGLEESYSMMDRWLNVYDDPVGDTDTTLTQASFLPAAAGRRTFYLLGRRSGGTGTVRIYDSTLSVLFIPAPSLTAASCGAVQTGVWPSSYLAFSPIRQCTLDVPSGSWVFISANATVNWNTDEARGRFEIGIDTTASGDWNMDRWIDTYPDSGDGSDDGLALTMLRQVPAGTHTFYLLGMHDVGPGSVDVYDASLTVLALGAHQVYLPMILRAY